MEHAAFLHDDANAFESEANPDGGDIATAKHADEVIVATAAGDARIESFGLDFEDGAGVVVETACEFWADADFDAVVERRRCFDDNAKFANGIHRIFVIGKYRFHIGECCRIIFFDFEKAQELLCTFGCDAALSEFFENAIVSNFVEFIDGGNGRRFEGFVDPRDGDHGSQNASIVDVNGEFVEV